MRRLLAISLPMLLAPVLSIAVLLAPGPVWADPVNINSADAATIARELKGVGPAKAEAIVQYRQQHGPFRSADELALVKGIGPKFIEKNRAQIRIDAVRRPAVAAGGAKTVPAVPAARPAR